MLVAGRDMDFWLLAERCVESSSPDARAEAPIAKRDGPAVEDGEVAIERPVVDNVPRRMQEQADVLCPLRPGPLGAKHEEAALQDCGAILGEAPVVRGIPTRAGHTGACMNDAWNADL